MTLPLFRLLSLCDETIRPQVAKIHLATKSDTDPLLEFTRGTFESWQSWQNKKNFPRPLVVSLIQYRQRERWLFAGAYDVRGVSPRGDRFIYQLETRASCTELAGRVVVTFERTFRQSYLNAESYGEDLDVREILPVPFRFPAFPGYRRVSLTKSELDALVERQPLDWKTALESVGGVYVLTDRRSGRLYVGSAAGAGGIWQRWRDYSASGGHAGNKGLRDLIGAEGAQRADDFSFAILEVADADDPVSDVLAREAHWKRVLLTREHGLNEN